MHSRKCKNDFDQKGGYQKFDQVSINHMRMRDITGKSAEIPGHFNATNLTITQELRLLIHPKWIPHPFQTYARCLSTFICNGWAFLAIIIALSPQVLSQILEIS
jgi:hypothetical protein